MCVEFMRFDRLLKTHRVSFIFLSFLLCCNSCMYHRVVEDGDSLPTMKLAPSRKSFR
jgi:hypothetical protein